MSEKTKKVRAAPRKSPKPAKEEIKKPVGHLMPATVSTRHGTGMIVRAGKGFSMGELSAINLSAKLAGRWSVPRDFRRRSVLEPNVQSLKNWFAAPHHKPAALPAEPVPEPKPVAEAKPAKKRTVRKKKGAAPA